MTEKVAVRVQTAAEYPWVKPSPDPASKEEHAYISALLIAKLRKFLADDGSSELVNWGSGPSPTQYTPDIENLKKNPNVGSFGIFAALVPDDLDLYREILPKHFSMPEQPVLSLVNLDYNQPNPIVRYREGMVMLKGVGADKEEAWYVHSMPVETWLMLMMGHDWGFRKDLFDMTITRNKTTVMQKDGDLYMSLELTSDAWPDDAKELVPKEHCGGTNNMAVIHPRYQDLMLRFGWNGKGYALEEENKMVKIKVNKALDWAGLIPKDGLAPGYFQRYTVGGGDSYVKKVR